MTKHFIIRGTNVDALQSLVSKGAKGDTGAAGSGTLITDGSKGDITTASSGASWTINNNAVTNAKINDLAVTSAKLGNTAVTTAKIADANVTTAKLADDAVTNAKIGPAAVGTTEIADDGVTNAKIAAGAVGTTELADDSVTAAKIGDTTIPIIITELSTGVWSGDLPARAAGERPAICIGTSDPADATNGIDTPANFNNDDQWIPR